MVTVIQLMLLQLSQWSPTRYGAPGGEGSTDPAILALSEAIPGTPGEDYPIYRWDIDCLELGDGEWGGMYIYFKY